MLIMCHDSLVKSNYVFNKQNFYNFLQTSFYKVFGVGDYKFAVWSEVKNSGDGFISDMQNRE